jgi:molybdate transport system ATP-binding protein
MNDAILTANFQKQFPGGPRIVADNLRVGRGITVLFGASGSGKTTILHCLAGLERPQIGTIAFGQERWFDSAKRVFQPPRKRGVGFVPQDYALFPHLSVGRNVSYGLQELAAAERASRVTEILRWLGVEGLAHRLPAELSGGQQQRVALARAVACRPKLLLLDEPFAALDLPTRSRVRGELRQLLRQLDIPTLLVTHDRLEALALGDEVVVLHEGLNVQQGPVHEVFSRPVSLAVAEIAAVETIQPGRVLTTRDGLATVAVGAARLVVLAVDLPPETSEVYVCIRAEDVSLMRPGKFESSPRNRLAATVRAVAREGPLVRVNLDCGFPLTALLTEPAREELALCEGMELLVLIKASQVHLIPLS